MLETCEFLSHSRRYPSDSGSTEKRDDQDPGPAWEAEKVVYKVKAVVDGRLTGATKETWKGQAEERLGSGEESEKQTEKRNKKGKEEVLELVSTKSQRERGMGSNKVHERKVRENRGDTTGGRWKESGRA